MNRKHNRLLALQASNTNAPRAYSIQNAGNEATIFLYDVIGYDWFTGGGITALQFAADLSALRGVDTINVRINSPGGDVFDGRAMCAILDAHPARKVAYVDGWAASAASFIAMHCDEVVIAQGAMLMIHNGWTVAAGDNRVMTDTANVLLKIDGAIQDDYLRRTNASREQLLAWMDAETFFTAEEAVEHGFADRIAEGDGIKARKDWSVSAYANAPTAEAAPDDTADADHAHRLRMVMAALNPA